ncbi:DegT/DnrJ/EryC1/StrS family aminotransferase [Cerasicoccus arenae]|uniref:Spore coat protein n=1 Tax=Cerasicoccus arenae TaxID=424488 RepID=A0A8J3DIQ6_9BACT|nr:DegT/DnrJ/EryC1/StrS aminotransferase family protein [Cerasicoccus arenae]MBK1857979.1 DegT/DnrJ/EryC1/StrS aminotransferase family protein [Cerasicoccus arenae]GHB97695.1 spore coat protein [Cerasicoccus arenae]
MPDDAPFLPFAKPSISPEAIAEVVACLESGWITTGPRSQKFEGMLREFFHAPSAQCCSSATAGLHMALLTLDLQPGDEVITTAMTFVATLNTIVLAGSKPVLVDVDPATGNLDVNQLEEAITMKTRAIMPVHFAGLPVDLDAVYALAERHELRVIEDCAHAIGAEYRGQRLGSFGDTQVFSFHPNKNMTTGEGGVVVTRDDQMVAAIEKLRFHGIDRSAENEFGQPGTARYDIALAGYKFNFMDLQAALGIHQLPALEGFNTRRCELAERYLHELVDCPAVTIPNFDGVNYPYRHAWHLFAPRLNLDTIGMSRDAVTVALKTKGIGSGLHYQAPHLSTYYRDEWGFKRGQFPGAEDLSDRIISLPLFPDMTNADQDRVIAAVRELID